MLPLRIFLSHSHKDNLWCEQLVTALERAGFSVWFDKQGLYVGTQWVQRLEDELQQRDVFLIVLTPDAWASQWVKEELHLALGLQKQIMGIIHKETRRSGFITNRQLLNAVGQTADQAAQTIASALGVVSQQGNTSAPPLKEPQQAERFLSALQNAPVPKSVPPPRVTTGTPAARASLRSEASPSRLQWSVWILDALLVLVAVALVVVIWGGSGISLLDFLLILAVPLVIAAATLTITQVLTDRKMRNLTAVLITSIGSTLAARFVSLPFEFHLARVPVMITLLSSIIIDVFYGLLLGRRQG